MPPDAKERNSMTEAISMFPDAGQFASHLRLLHEERRRRKLEVRARGLKRQSLSLSERQAVLNKTAARCHICGGEIAGKWDADHVFSHAQGGPRTVDNYLPAHSLCNNYRWFYGTEEFQWILKLGVWFRTQIENDDDLALELAERFVRHEARRNRRRGRP
jgi:hypothetical protein